jgi:hypothetical protein
MTAVAIFWGIGIISVFMTILTTNGSVSTRKRIKASCALKLAGVQPAFVV